jgi:uncharacterized protein DUF4079
VPETRPLAARDGLEQEQRVPLGAARVAAFLHPALSVIALAVLGFAASLGLRSRERGGAPLRARHARIAPWALGLTIANAAFGLLSTWLWRHDLEPASGWHFGLAVALVAVLLVAQQLSRRIHTSPMARRVHPLLGMLALLVAALQVFFGLALLPL